MENSELHLNDGARGNGRTDICPDLIHFTRDLNIEAAFKKLQKIITDRKLIGSSNLIRGQFRCVCFSEAPSSSLQNGLVNPELYSKYSPFGIMVSKKFVFKHDGRPVVYQRAVEYDELSPNIQWRHMTFDLNNDDSLIDFTWEREWRVRCDEFAFDEQTATIVVRDQSWADRLIKEFQDVQNMEVVSYIPAVGETLAQLYAKPFTWKIVTLQ